MSYKQDVAHYLSIAQSYIAVGEYGIAIFSASLAADRIKQVKPTRHEVIEVKRVLGEAYLGLEKRLNALAGI